ncbi:bile acid:sodium symporter family protein [Thermoleophilia bacterium SCSIO 60948]|nr:bile acid:sodium symporter family protein [Thermoleophilia bacterium SCSIO 60948]
MTELLPVALALIMASLGLSLTPADFKRIATKPRGIAIGLGNLLILSPVLALAIAEAFELEAVFAVGLVLLGASPGGTLANMLTHLARGDTALSVSMTALSSLAAAVTVPLYLAFAVEHFGASVSAEVETLGIAIRVFAITVVPLSIGMLIRARAPGWTERNQPTARKVALVAFVLVVIGAVISEFALVRDHILELAAATLALNVAAMAISYSISRLARLDTRQSTAVAIELGVHNSTLAIAVGSLVAEPLIIPAAIYSAFMFLTAGAFARVMHSRNPEPAT